MNFSAVSNVTSLQAYPTPFTVDNDADTHSRAFKLVDTIADVLSLDEYETSVLAKGLN